MVFRPSSPTRILPRLRVRNNTSNQPVDLSDIECERTPTRGRKTGRRGSCGNCSVTGSVTTKTSTRSRSTRAMNRDNSKPRLIIDLNALSPAFNKDEIPTSPNSSSSSLSSMDIPTTPVRNRRGQQGNFEASFNMSGLHNSSKSTIDNHNQSFGSSANFRSPIGAPPMSPMSCKSSNSRRRFSMPKSKSSSRRRMGSVTSPVRASSTASYSSAEAKYFESPRRQVRDALRNIQQLDDSHHSRSHRSRRGGHSTTGSICSTATPIRGQPTPYHPSRGVPTSILPPTPFSPGGSVTSSKEPLKQKSKSSSSVCSSSSSSLKKERSKKKIGEKSRSKRNMGDKEPSKRTMGDKKPSMRRPKSTSKLLNKQSSSVSSNKKQRSVKSMEVPPRTPIKNASSRNVVRTGNMPAPPPPTTFEKIKKKGNKHMNSLLKKLSSHPSIKKRNNKEEMDNIEDENTRPIMELPKRTSTKRTVLLSESILSSSPTKTTKSSRGGNAVGRRRQSVTS